MNYGVLESVAQSGEDLCGAPPPKKKQNTHPGANFQDLFTYCLHV